MLNDRIDFKVSKFMHSRKSKNVKCSHKSVRRIKESDMAKLAKATGARIVTNTYRAI